MPDKIECFKLVFELSGNIASDAQQRCSALFHQHLSGALSRLLEHLELSTVDRLRIERLVIDLGDISLMQFEEQLAQRLSARLTECLSALLAAAPPVAAGEELFIQQGGIAATLYGANAGEGEQQHPISEGDKHRRNNEEAASRLSGENREYSPTRPAAGLAPLFHYLRLGYLSAQQWPDAQGWQRPGGADSWLQPRLAQLSAAQRTTLAYYCLQAVPRQRLLQTFSEATLQTVCRALAADESVLAAPSDKTALQARLVLNAQSYSQQRSDGTASGLTDEPAEQASATGTTKRGVLRDEHAGPPAEQVSSTMLREPLTVPNAGMVLLWPLLPGLFRTLGLLEKQQFIDPQARLNAVCWLDELIWGDKAAAEWRTPLTRLLCGVPLEQPLIPWSIAQPEVAEQMLHWLAAIPRQLPGLHRCQVNDLRNFFLQRPGKLIQTSSGWELTVHSDASDFLLSQLPWSMEHIVFPWMEMPLRVKWLLSSEGAG